ncbi:MAG: hypothetical protein Q9170_005801 [Blastenia crenularia]
MNGQSSPNVPFPSWVNSDNTITHHGFKITTRKLPILKAEPIERMTTTLGIAPPEMIFGDNLASIEHLASGWSIVFDALHALERVDKTGTSMLQVVHSKEWQSTREKRHGGITEVVKPFDWSYSTDYKGTERSKSPLLQPSDSPIPLELLKRPDPIIFFDEVMLYEDEMADNGITTLSCKVRVMPARLLLLCRFFMRLDGVMVRIRDTRVYIEFITGEIIREYTAREDKYEAVRQKLAMKGRDVPAQLRDPNNLVDILPVIDKTVEQIMIPSSLVRIPTNQRLISTSNSSAAQIIPDTLRAPPRASPSTPPAASTSTSKPPQPQPHKSEAVPPPSKFVAEVRKLAPSITEPYIAYGICEKLIKECANQANYSIPQRYEKNGVVPTTADGQDLALGLTPTFNNWAQVTFLHMYILTVRLRAFPPSVAPTWRQHLLDHFFYTAEDRMVRDHNVASRMIRNKYLKDLFTQWRGVLAAYDEGLVKGDAVLATALWRNVFDGKEDVDLRGLAEVVSYMRGVLKGLEGMDDEEVGKGDVVFGNPGTQRKVVEVRSRMMDALPKEMNPGPPKR